MKHRNRRLIGIGSLLAVAASVFVFRRNRNQDQEKPPKRAPQLNIENPGSQDDFPKPPMESEIG
jgi:hypothetical protein